MTTSMWNSFRAARDDFKNYCAELDAALPGLRRVQQKLVNTREGPSYQIDTPIVYNNALDDVTRHDVIKLILIGDNPGRREQSAAMRRYLVGPSGKIAERFFASEASLGIDFRGNVIILNKTPVHTPRTAELRILAEEGGAAIRGALIESQKKMAALLTAFQNALNVPVWITGYSEMKKNGIFFEYTNALCAAFERDAIDPQEILCFRHFSMNQFTIDLNKQRSAGEALPDALNRIGAAYRARIFGGLFSKNNNVC